jgi:broad specificity phosphatase PhoE
VSSPLARCRATADVVAGALGVGVEVDERWIELDYGELDGVAMVDVPAATWAAWRADVEWCPPRGESLVALGRRVRAACDELAAVPDHDVVVVTHVSPLKAAVAWALGVGDEVTWRMYVAPASISTVAVRGGVPSLHSFNEVTHLG